MSSTFQVDDIVSNYHDSINNIVYGLQRYFEEFRTYLYQYMEHVDMSKLPFDDADFIGFLVCESDAILRNKILRTSIEICNIFSVRMRLIMKRISQESSNAMFDLSVSSFEKLTKQYNEYIRTNSKLVKRNTRKKEISQSIFDFKTLIDNIGNGKVQPDTMKSKDEILCYLKNVTDYYNTVLTGMKVLIEGCSSYLVTSSIIHDMVICLILGCDCISSIGIHQEDICNEFPKTNQ